MYASVGSDVCCHIGYTSTGCVVAGSNCWNASAGLPLGMILRDCVSGASIKMQLPSCVQAADTCCDLTAAEAGCRLSGNFLLFMLFIVKRCVAVDFFWNGPTVSVDRVFTTCTVRLPVARGQRAQCWNCVLLVCGLCSKRCVCKWSVLQ